MRSIGKKNESLVKNETIKELKKQKVYPFSEVNYSQARENIREVLPVELWDTWECADSQINNLIDEVLNQYAHGVIAL